GCDASILLDGNNTEKTAFPNQSLRGYNLIDTIKKRLEKVCPGIVSCVDIITIATRDAISLATPLTRQEKPWKFSVQTRRMDGKVSSASNTVDLPPPTISVKDSIKLFQKKGLNATDMVFLLGGHTVGVTHCSFIQDRLYNFRNTTKPDPTMNPTLVRVLRRRCPQRRSSGNNTINLDQNRFSSLTVDNSYYKQLLLNKGILRFDQDLASDRRTKNAVKLIAKSTYEEFNINFAQAIVKMQAVDVITNPKKGQIRRSCRAVN
ncbi:Peroxidase, partial [Trema orientale]